MSDGEFVRPRYAQMQNEFSGGEPPPKGSKEAEAVRLHLLIIDMASTPEFRVIREGEGTFTLIGSGREVHVYADGCGVPKFWIDSQGGRSVTCDDARAYLGVPDRYEGGVVTWGRRTLSPCDTGTLSCCADARRSWVSCAAPAIPLRPASDAAA